MARSGKPKPRARSKSKPAVKSKTKPKAAPKPKAGSKPKAASKGKPVSRVDWTDVKNFLRKGWPSRVKAGSSTSVGAQAAEAFRRWGRPVPKDLALFYAPLQDGKPALFEWEVRSHAPELKAGNLAEQLILAAQRYRPLWAEVFGACVEIGSTGNGDLWMYAFDPVVDHAPQILKYVHEGDEIELASDGLGAAVLRSAIVAAHKAGEVDDTVLQAATRALEKHVTNAWQFEEQLHVHDEAKTSDDDINQYCYSRSQWLITLLAEDDASDAAIRGGFDVEMNPPLSLERLAGKDDLFADFPPASFYYCLRAFFEGNDAVLDKALKLAKGSKAPLVGDLVALIRVLRKGQKKLGVISDVAALRNRVTALALSKPVAVSQAAAPSPEAEAKAAAAEREGTLEELAWSAVGTDRDTLKAVVNRWAGSENVGESVKWNRALRKPDGYIDEGVRDTLVKQGNHCLAPALTYNARNKNFGAYHVLIEWGIARAIPFLVEETRAVDNFHIQRKHFVRLVHRVGDAQYAPLLLDILKQFPPKDSENARSEMLAALCVALGDLGNAASQHALLGLLDTEIDGVGSESQWSLKNAVPYALARLGEQRALVSLTRSVCKTQSFADLKVFARYWAAAHLAVRSGDDKAKAKIVDALRTLAAPLESKSENEESIASLLEGSATYITPQLAIHLGLVELGEPADALRVLVSSILEQWDGERWDGYDAHAMLQFALFALPHTPGVDRALAESFLDGEYPHTRERARRAR